MVFAHNPIPANTAEGLALLERLRDDLRYLKVEAYGPDSNKYGEDKPRSKLRDDIPAQELHDWVSTALPDHVLAQIREERLALGPKLEDTLDRTAIEEMLPIWVPPHTTVMYVLRVEGRNKEQMSEPERGLHAGYIKKQTPIRVLTAGELRRRWREILITDKELQRDSERYLPPDADYILSSVHKVYLAAPLEKCYRSNGNNNGELILDGRRADDKLQVHFRNKSGPELLWKMITYMTGLEEKPKEGSRETILDEAGARFITADDYEKLSINLHQHFARMHKMDWTGAVLLQALPTGRNGRKYGEGQKELFLRRVPRNLRKFYRRIIEVEDRSTIDLSGKAEPPYYLEMLAPIGMQNGVFGRNVIDILTYPLSVFKTLYGEHGHDPFAYKTRDEGWRVEHYTLMEWLVGLRLAKALMDENGIRYVRDLADVRMREAKLLSRRERSYVLAP